MHGIKRTRISPQAAEAKRQKEEAKIQAYTILQDEVLHLKKSKVYSPEALSKTTELLDLNPEFYTIWNYRRHILVHLFETTDAEGVVKLLSGELRLTIAYLQVHPKVYWIWNHRKWCLENVPQGPQNTEEWRNEFWKTELIVIEKMLDADARNFHAWDYRRYVLASLPASFIPRRTPQDELRYTQKKIESNFSNFSAWHCRTKILGGLWESMPPEGVDQAKDKEFELVTQALWTDPGDQSGWMYHRWLIGSASDEDRLRKEIESIRELHGAEPDSKWCMNALSQYVLLSAKTSPPDEAAKLRDEAKTLLNRLAEIDSLRKARYIDMGKSFVSVARHWLTS